MPTASPPHTIHGSLAGATFAFTCDAPDLMRYAGRHLAPLVAADLKPAVDATLAWYEGQPPAQRVPVAARSLQRVDRDLYASSEQLYWFRVDDLRDLFLSFTWRQKRLSVAGEFFHRLSNDAGRDRAKRWLNRRRLPDLRRRRFTTLLYYLVYYPCWWWLEQTRDVHPIHAAGVRLGDGVILLAGASGVGKSTLAVALASLPGARLLSDSFVLHNGSDVLPVREPVLLDDWSRNWLGAAAGELEPVDAQYGLDRSGYHLPAGRLAEGGRAQVLVFPRRAPAPSLRRLTSDEAHHRLSAADLIVNDLRRYWAFAAILEQMAPAGLMARREAHLARLTADVPCYEIGLTAEMSSRAVAESVVQLMGDTPLRAAGAHP